LHKQSNKIESLQRRAALICSGAYRHTKHSDLLSELGWDILSDRRKHHKLTLFYKITHTLVPKYLQDIIPGTIGSTTTHNLRNSNHIKIKTRRLYISKTSFVPSTTRTWNTLPESTKFLPSVLSFKNLLKKQTNKTTPFHRKCTGKVGNWLGLSALNAQRTAYHLITQPECTNCHHEAESLIHYFTKCHSYALARTKLYGRLERELEIDIVNANTEDITNILLHGIVHPNKVDTLLEITYEYMKSTERFK
jgi:hypothetical protein